MKVVRITYADGGTVEVDEGTSVLDASLRHGVNHMHACGGVARCTTCRVEVLAGFEHCPAPRGGELEVVELNRIKPPVRLACSLRPTGDITVRVLLREHDHERPGQAEERAREVNVAVLFADIRGFTAFAERSLPFDVLHLLNRYFDRLGTVVELHGGRVVSFLGDGMMCVFGLAGDGESAAVQAVSAAIEMLDATNRQAIYCAEHFSLDLRVGIGVDFGRAVVGEVGYYRNMQFNAIGDVVNTAARVQDLTKETGSDLLITEAVRDRLDEGVVFGREHALEIRGKTRTHRLYEVLPPS